MSASHQDNPMNRQVVEPEVFARFLKLLSVDPEEAGRHYTSLQKKLIRFFTMKGIADPVSAADETLDRTILKIVGGAMVPDVDKYCLGIARNIYKEKTRLSQRESTAFHTFMDDLSNSSAAQVERIYQLLQPCFEQLAVDEQQLLLAYCRELPGQERGDYRRQLAEKMKMSVTTLRVRVTRLRDKLTECVRKRSALI
jgi:hypothetical protein